VRVTRDSVAEGDVIHVTTDPCDVRVLDTESGPRRESRAPIRRVPDGCDHGPVTVRGIVVGVLACVALTGCGAPTGSPSDGQPFTLPVGPTEWDPHAPSWFHAGTLHVGEQTLELGDDVGVFVLGSTGVYWMRGHTLMFTSAEGATQEVQDLGQSNLAVSTDRSVLATVDQSHGPTDEYGAHVLQVVAFDTRSGEQLYRTPDEEPQDGADLTDLYEETMPLLDGVSDEHIFFDHTTIELDDGSTVPADESEGYDVYDGYAETLFPDGYRVAIRGEGRRRVLDESSSFASGLLSPDRSTLLDAGTWPSPAVVYDATTGRQRSIHAPWRHFTLGGWSDQDTFFGVAQRIDETDADTVLRARQVVTCELRTLACTAASPVLPGDDGPVLMEGSDLPT
jgi:hypothetical protein